jgi:hypothetical protein
MKTSKGGVKLATIFTLAFCMAAGSALAAEPVCHGGVLSDAQTGKPLLDANRSTIPCRAPEANASDGEFGGYVIAAAVGSSVLAVGICAAARCFDHQQNQWPFFFAGNSSSASP